jgi:hypothetical protein
MVSSAVGCDESYRQPPLSGSQVTASVKQSHRHDKLVWVFGSIPGVVAPLLVILSSTPCHLLGLVVGHLHEDLARGQLVAGISACQT